MKHTLPQFMSAGTLQDPWTASLAGASESLHYLHAQAASLESMPSGSSDGQEKLHEPASHPVPQSSCMRQAGPHPTLVGTSHLSSNPLNLVMRVWSNPFPVTVVASMQAAVKRIF